VSELSERRLYSIWRLGKGGRAAWVFSNIPAASPSRAFGRQLDDSLIRDYPEPCLYFVADPDFNPDNDEHREMCHLFYPDGRPFDV
jgi:hypothetical protein